ncbi:hypothetical protein EG349_11935 [Chryseobacterium shandongense]|uniref:Uncharacterized protein n=1 Tax=Chryseobacterium shandongense TaxID=1493872 RepID=A0AAD0YDK3_9FLAO|nr:hypothetical protein EG349_11935 [Chryseobacterium shandongense]AZA95950.1 hypothetical protein EG353_10390 [Chryseobacterium shandongense]
MFSCKKSNVKGYADRIIEPKKIQKNETNEFVKTKLNCSKLDGFIKKCTFENYTFEVKETTEFPIVEFHNATNLYYYNFEDSFDGIGSNAYLFKENNKKILLFELEYEYNSLVYVFEIEKSDIKLVDKIKFQISEGNYEFNIFKRTDGIYIDFKQGEVKVKEKISSDFIIQNLDSETIKNVINNNVSWWDGTYTTKIEIVRDMEVNQLEVILKINDNNATLKFLSKNNASSINLIIKNFSLDKILLNDEDNNQEYIIQKKGKDYWLSGKSAYLINPPNEKYLLRKITK